MVNDSKKSSPQQAVRFSVVSNGKSASKGYLLYYDRNDSDSTRRVMISSLFLPDNKVNFPEFDAENQTKESVTAKFYIRTQHQSRNQMFLVFAPNTAPQPQNGEADFFSHLPLGFIVGQTVYLISEAQHRVYYFAYQSFGPTQYDLTKSTLEVHTKSWPEFFICNPNLDEV